MGHAYGRTLRRSGDLVLLALPVGAGLERYCVATGETPLATFAGAGPAVAFFEALCAADGGAPGESTPRDAGGKVTDLAAYRRARNGAAGRRQPRPSGRTWPR